MRKNGTILIVDDQKVMRETIGGMLQQQDYYLEFASGGEEALQKAGQIFPDLILLDIMMPDIDGIEVCRRLRAHPVLAQVPIVMVTALTDRESWMKGMEAGADDFVFKPFDMAELRTRVQNITQLNRYRQLLAERMKFEWVVKHADDGYLMLNKEGRILYANARACLYLDVPADDNELMRTSFRDHVERLYNLEPKEAWSNWPQKPANNIPRYLVRPETATAAAFWLRVNALNLPPGVDAAQVVHLRDVTDQMVLQRDVWRFHSMVFHKLRTPLIAILHNLELLVRREKSLAREEIGELSREALAGAQRLSSEVEDVLQYVKADTLAKAGNAFPLAQLKEVANQIGDQLGISELEVAGHEKLRGARLSISTQGMELILLEILENAKKFHPRGMPAVQLFLFKSGKNKITLWIGDNGLNLSPEQLAQVWLPYYQAEKSFTGEVAGMGLGLAMVASLVWSAGGSCRMYNRSGGPGVVVELALPLERQAE